MAIASLDAHIHLESPIHRWAPRLKLVSLMLLVFAFAMVHHLPLVPPMVGITALLYASSRLPLRFLRQRLSYPGLFILALVVALPFVSGTTVLWQWGWVALRQEGLVATALILCRFVSILTIGFILLGTTPFLTMIRAMRALGLPSILSDMTLLAYRYLYDMADALGQMQLAMRLRGYGRQRRWGLSSAVLHQLTALIGAMLVRSYERSERVYRAMGLRGYGQPSSSKICLGPPTDPVLSWGLTVATVAAAAALMIAEGVLAA